MPTDRVTGWRATTSGFSSLRVPGSLALGGFALLAVLGGCSGVRHRPEIAERLQAVDPARLESHVVALTGIGPRPMEDSVATAATVAYLTETLGDMGLAVVEEPVTFRPTTGRFFARVRPKEAGAESEPLEIDLPLWFGGYGARVLAGQSQRLRADGYVVLGYAGSGYAFAAEDASVPNLLVTIPGTSGRAGLVEVSAHYDTVPGSPGADDNSSGVAALLEIARVLAAHPPERSVRLCFFAGEEADLRGSAVHIENVLASGEDVVGLLNLDSIGIVSDAPDSQQAPVRIVFVTWMPSTGDFITVIGDWDSGPLGNLFETASDSYVPDLPYYSANRIGGWFADGRRSDHAHYWDAGIPAIFLTDTGEFRTDTYHKPGDVAADLDYAHMERVTRATLASIYELTRR